MLYAASSNLKVGAKEFVFNAVSHPSKDDLTRNRNFYYTLSALLFIHKVHSCVWITRSPMEMLISSKALKYKQLELWPSIWVLCCQVNIETNHLKLAQWLCIPKLAIPGSYQSLWALIHSTAFTSYKYSEISEEGQISICVWKSWKKIAKDWWNIGDKWRQGPSAWTRRDQALKPLQWILSQDVLWKGKTEFYSLGQQSLLSWTPCQSVVLASVLMHCF